LICSEEATWITGQLIEVDGGASLEAASALFAFDMPWNSNGRCASTKEVPL
jgi:hypothetical protein